MLHMDAYGLWDKKPKLRDCWTNKSRCVWNNKVTWSCLIKPMNLLPSTTTPMFTSDTWHACVGSLGSWRKIVKSSGKVEDASQVDPAIWMYNIKSFLRKSYYIMIHDPILYIVPRCLVICRTDFFTQFFVSPVPPPLRLRSSGSRLLHCWVF